MKESTGHMFPDIYTTNHISGLGPCFFSCPYCSKRRYTEEIRKHLLNQQALKENLGSSKRIFVASGSDIAAPNITDEEILTVFDHIHSYPGNEYMIQSKSPGRLTQPQFMNHPVWQHSLLGTTIETNLNLSKKYMGKAPCVQERAAALSKYKAAGIKTYVSLEPLMQFELYGLVELVKSFRPKFAYIGRDSLRRVHLPEPYRYEVVDLAKELQCFTTVIIKDNAECWK